MARPLEFDRCQAVAQAKALFHQTGYEATSIDDLTHALGISRASLYNTFGDKHGLLMATLDAACDDAQNMFTVAANRRCAAKKIIREMFEMLATPNNQGCYLLTLGAELSAADPQVQARVQAALNSNRAMFADILSRDPNLSPKQIESKSAALLGAMVAILTLTRVHPDPKLLEAVIQHALTILE